MLLVLVPEPLDVYGGIVVEGGAGGCVEACYEGSDVEDRCCVVCIYVRVTLCCVKVDMWKEYWFLNETCVFDLRL
jgi:hypothetical protein